MKKLIVLFFLVSLLNPMSSNAEWIRLFTISEGDLFLESSSIKRKKNRIFYSQLVNYNKKKTNNVFSFISHSELDCNNLMIRDLNYELYSKRMGKGKNFYTPNFHIIDKKYDRAVLKTMTPPSPPTKLTISNNKNKLTFHTMLIFAPTILNSN